MNSPHSHHGSETGPNTEHALRPAVKLMFASATLLAGFGTAALHWNGAKFDDSFFVCREQVDEKLLDAPLPTPLLAATIPIEIKSLDLPTIPAFEASEGHGKYAQAYPPPVLVPDKTLEAEARKNDPIVPVNYMTEKKLMPPEKEMAPLHSFERAAAPPVIPLADQLTREPVQLDPVRESDALLTEYQEIENMKALMNRQTVTQPVNPFATDLVPLQPSSDLVLLQPSSDLVPLQPSRGLVTLQPRQ